MSSRKGVNPGSIKQTTLSDIKFSTPEAEVVVCRDVTLGKQIKIPSSRAGSGGSTLTKSASVLSADTLEYLYLTNSYIFRGIEQTAAAIVRNGYEIIASSESDQEFCNAFRKNNRLDSKLLNTARNAALFGNAYWELYDGEPGPMVAELPPSEMDFKRDPKDKSIIYSDDAEYPDGYVQKRSGDELAEWDSDFIVHFKFIEIGASDLGVPLIQPAVFPCTEFGLIRGNLADSFIRSLNVVHVSVEGATPEDLEEVAARLQKQFTAETAYVTSERYTMSNMSNVGNNINPAQFLEPAIADIAASFSMPIELIAATSTITLSDLPTRYAEWLESIKSKQRLLAEILETQVFGRLLDDPVEVQFNNPNPSDINTLMKHLGFAVQSNAITEDQSQKILERLKVFPEVE